MLFSFTKSSVSFSSESSLLMSLQVKMMSLMVSALPARLILSQSVFPKCLYSFSSSIFRWISLRYHFIIFLVIFFFTSDVSVSLRSLIKNLMVVPFTTIVSSVIPAVWNNTISRISSLISESKCTIRANAIDTAPLKPEYVNRID